MCNEIWVCLLRSSWSKPATNKKATRPLQSHQHISHHSVTSYWDPPKKSQPEKRGHDWEKFVLIEHENDNRLIPKVYLEPNTFQELCTPCKDVLVVKLFEEKPHSTLFLASLLWAWRNWNFACLNNETWSPSHLVTNIYNSADTIVSTFNNEDTTTTFDRSVKWNCNNHMGVILNVDGSCNGTHIRTGFGGISATMRVFSSQLSQFWSLTPKTFYWLSWQQFIMAVAGLLTWESMTWLVTQIPSSPLTS